MVRSARGKAARFSVWSHRFEFGTDYSVWIPLDRESKNRQACVRKVSSSAMDDRLKS